MARPNHLLQSLPDGPPEMTPEGGIGMQSQMIGELVAAKAAADHELRNVSKSKSNDFFHSTYADLDAVTKQVRPIYGKHGLMFAQAPWFIDGTDVLVTTLAHNSGQWIRSVMRLEPVPNKEGNITPQAHGSALTYARRYALSGMANIAQTDEDDDGNAASTPPLVEHADHYGGADEDGALKPPTDDPPFPQTEDETKLFNAIDAISSMDTMRMFSTSPEMQQLRQRVRREVWIGPWDAKKKEIIDGNR